MLMRRPARLVVGIVIACCAFMIAGCSTGTDRQASSPPGVAAPETVVGSWVLRLGDRDDAEEFSLDVKLDGTVVATDRCNFIASNWLPTADPSNITFAATTLTQRFCADRPDFIGLLTSARRDTNDHLLVTASGREWTYERRQP
jgi:heat shock protein HslJ